MFFAFFIQLTFYLSQTYLKNNILIDTFYWGFVKLRVKLKRNIIVEPREIIQNRFFYYYTLVY